MRRGMLLLALLLIPALTSAASVTIDFGETKSYSLELNQGEVAQLTVTIASIPEANVSQLYVTYDSSTRDRVYCAPSPKTVNNDIEDFTCIVTPGDAFDGYVTFVALDKNGDLFSDNTKLHLTVSYKEQWFSTKTVAKVGSTINVGGYSITVKKASFIYATLLIDNSPVTVFVNDETKLVDDLYVTYKGFDPDTKEVFFEFRSHTPITASVQEVEYYLVAPRVVYSDGNEWTIDIYTNCSSVEYRLKGSDTWAQAPSPSGHHITLTIEENVDRVYLRCSDDDTLTQPVYLKRPKVIVQELNEDQIREKCTALGFITKDQCPKQDCAQYCISNGFVKPPAGYECKFVKPGSETNYTLLIGFLVLVVLAVLYYLYRKGKIQLPVRKKESVDFTEERPIEPAQDIE